MTHRIRPHAYHDRSSLFYFDSLVESCSGIPIYLLSLYLSLSFSLPSFWFLFGPYRLLMLMTSFMYLFSFITSSSRRCIISTVFGRYYSHGEGSRKIVKAIETCFEPFTRLSLVLLHLLFIHS